MKLQFFSHRPELIDLRPNEPTRGWMDHTSESYAYRCLPLNIANAHGWSFHLRKGFEVTWDGGPGVDALKIKSDEDVSDVCLSNFGHGILTFHVDGVFRTEPGWNIYCTGPQNKPKDGIYALTGIIETDWSPYSFTMNWRMSRPGTVKFKAGEPFCTVFPVQRHALEETEPEILPMSAAPALKQKHDSWSHARNKFNKDLEEPESDAAREKWQKAYYRGRTPDGGDGPEDHVIKLRLKEFKKVGF